MVIQQLETRHHVNKSNCTNSEICWQETNAVHVNVGAGSYLEVNIPMTVTENGKLKQKKFLYSLW